MDGDGAAVQGLGEGGRKGKGAKSDGLDISVQVCLNLVVAELAELGSSGR